MDRSESIGELVTALAKAQADFTPAVKEVTNTFFNSKYADLAATIDAVRPALNKHGIALIQFDRSDLVRQVAIVTTALHHGEQFLSITAEAPAVGSKGFNVQSLGACWTYLRRYTLQAICGIASEDDDGNSVADHQRDAVYAEVERQKSPAKALASDIPPELDWSYNKASGVLICRIVDAKKTKKKKSDGELVTLKLNNSIEGKSTIYYFHTTHVDLLLGSIGKVVKLMVETNGDFVNVSDVLEVAGELVHKPGESAEVQARLLASSLEFTEDDLAELVKKYSNGSWAIAVDKLKDEVARRQDAM